MHLNCNLCPHFLFHHMHLGYQCYVVTCIVALVVQVCGISVWFLICRDLSGLINFAIILQRERERERERENVCCFALSVHVFLLPCGIIALCLFLAVPKVDLIVIFWSCSLVSAFFLLAK